MSIYTILNQPRKRSSKVRYQHDRKHMQQDIKGARSYCMLKCFHNLIQRISRRIRAVTVDGNCSYFKTL